MLVRSSTSRRPAALDRRPRPAAHHTTLARLIEEHGSSLYSIALMILGDAAAAEEAVTQVLLGARERSATTDDTDRRRHLSRCVYVRCTRARLGAIGGGTGFSPVRSEAETSDPTGTEVRLASLSEEQRGAIALSFYGEHTYQEIAGVMSLPEAVAAELVRSGLRGLCAENPG